LLSKLVPGSLLKEQGTQKGRDSPLKHIDNIKVFLGHLEKLGVPKSDLFEWQDLHHNLSMRRVLHTLGVLSDKAKYMGYKGPLLNQTNTGRKRRSFDSREEEQPSTKRRRVEVFTRRKSTFARSTHSPSTANDDPDIALEKDKTTDEADTPQKRYIEPDTPQKRYIEPDTPQKRYIEPDTLQKRYIEPDASREMAEITSNTNQQPLSKIKEPEIHQETNKEVNERVDGPKTNGPVRTTTNIPTIYPPALTQQEPIRLFREEMQQIVDLIRNYFDSSTKATTELKNQLDCVHKDLLEINKNFQEKVEKQKRITANLRRELRGLQKSFKSDP